jgi:Uma2 family endonuclease
MTAHDPINVPHAAKLRMQDFMLLNDAGAFAEFAKSELIEGEIWVMNAAYSKHGKIQFELAFQLRIAMQANGIIGKIYTATSVDLGADSVPEPDIVVAQDHDDGPIPSAKVMLLVEVADSTLAMDLGRKSNLYAKARIPEYWVADVEGKVIHQHLGPSSDGYTARREVPFGEPIHSGTIEVLCVETGGLG